MPQIISAEKFISLSGDFPVIDVRSESEFQQGHIKGSINIPLFSDSERAVVGTIYKNSGREASVLKGLELSGPKLAGFVKQLHKVSNSKQVLVHCWRGGMRSNSMAWLFEQAGYEVYVLQGGYKSFRHYLHDFFQKKFNFIIIGGYTGSGKTDILKEFEKMGEQVLDLEELAFHKGSAFGGRTDGFQPSNEQFYNDIFDKLKKFDLKRKIWVEDESRMIGKVSVPDEIFARMSSSPLVKIMEPYERRINRLVNEYSVLPPEYLENCLEKIGEKLGGTRLKAAKDHLYKADFAAVAAISLEYYDKAYEHSISLRSSGRIIMIDAEGKSPEDIAGIIKLKCNDLS